jgi:putative ABC transport system permease protein
LLITAGLLIRALGKLQSTEPGFRPEGVLTLRTSLPMPQYQQVARRDQFYDHVLSNVRALPGVTDVAYISFLPIVHPGGIWPVSVGGKLTNRAMSDSASLRFVTPGYFRTMRIPIRAGRDASETDTREAPFVAVVSESFVRRYWPGEDPLGRRFTIGFRERTVVGVAADVKVRGLERNNEPQVYLPHRQVPDGGLTWYAPKDLVVRATTDPMSLLPAVRRIIREADPQQPVSDVQTLQDIVDGSTGSRRLLVGVLVVFTSIAILLAAIGIHGLLSFTVSRRTPEIGVRIALGAQRRDILAMVLRETTLLAVGGVVAGILLSQAAARTIQSLLVGVPPSDLVTLVGAMALSLGMTLAGSIVPALRAVRVDPTRAIQSE